MLKMSLQPSEAPKLRPPGALRAGGGGDAQSAGVVRHSSLAASFWKCLV